MLLRRSLLILLALLLPACAQEPTLVVENGRVVVGDGTVMDRATVIIAGDSIELVTEDTATVPEGRRIDATGKTVLPGLIDTHVHLLMEELFAQPRSDGAMRQFLEEELPDRLRAYTEAGITTVMSTGDYWPFIADVKRRIGSGELEGPRLSIAGPIFTAPEGHPAVTFCGFLDKNGPNPWCREHLTVAVATAQEARDAVDRLDSSGVDFVKLVYEEGPQLEPLEPGLVGEVINAADEAELDAYGHVLEPAKALEAVRMGLDGLVHLPAAEPEDSTQLTALVEAMESEAVGVSTTLIIFDVLRENAEEQGAAARARQMEERVAGMQRTLGWIVERSQRGIPIAVGTDAPHLPPAEAYQRELALLKDAGLTDEEVLQAATGDAASYMGVADSLGTLEAGKQADLIVVDGDPTTDLAALQEVALVVREGEVVWSQDDLLAWIRSNSTTAIFFGVIFAVLLYGLLRYLTPVIRRARAFRRAQEKIEAETGETFPHAPFPEAHAWLNDLWRQYATARQDSSVEIEGEVVSPVDPESFFTRPQVLQNYNRRTALALAGVFLALGILGTFWGLVLGLEGVDTTTSEQLLDSVNSLLSGMSTAFWSSIAGITVSILWLLVDRWAFNRLRQNVQQFFRVVHGRWPVTSPDRAVYHDLALQVEHTRILQNLGTDLAQAFQQAIDASFSEKLSPALTSIDETLDRVASQVSDEQAEALDEMAAAFQDRLLDSVGEQFDELASAIQEATDWQRRVTNDVGSLFEQVTDLSQTNTRLLENSSQAAERFLASVDRLGESQKRLAETSDHLEEVARQTARLSQELEGQSQVFVDANEEIREELAKQLDQVEEQVGTLAEFWKEVHGDLERLSTSLSENLTEFTDLTEERLGQVFNRFDSEMGTVVEHLGGTLAELREVTEELGPTIQRVERALEKTVEPISESRQEVSALAQSIQSLDGLPEHLGTASREMASARDALRDLSARIESLDGQLGDGSGAPSRPEESEAAGRPESRGTSESPETESEPETEEEESDNDGSPWWQSR